MYKLPDNIISNYTDCWRRICVSYWFPAFFAHFIALLYFSVSHLLFSCYLGCCSQHCDEYWSSVRKIKHCDTISARFITRDCSHYLLLNIFIRDDFKSTDSKISKTDFEDICLPASCVHIFLSELRIWPKRWIKKRQKWSHMSCENRFKVGFLNNWLVLSKNEIPYRLMGDPRHRLLCGYNGNIIDIHICINKNGWLYVCKPGHICKINTYQWAQGRKSFIITIRLWDIFGPIRGSDRPHIAGMGWSYIKIYVLNFG